MQADEAHGAAKTVTGPPPLFDAEENAAIAARLFEHIDNGTTDLAPSHMLVDPAIYSDPRIAALEQERIFDVVPVIVAHESELPNANDFITAELPGNKVLIVRQEDGSVKAFVNACRHRSACLEEETSGSHRVFSCGYHGWCYNTDGSLRSISYPETFGEVDKSEFGLIPLPCEARHGLVWVIQKPGAPIDVAEFLGPTMDAVLAGYRMGDMHTHKASSFEDAMNWKVAEDAFVDGYHLKFVHPKSAGPHFYTNIQIFEDHGAHGRAITPRKRIDRIRFDPAGSAPIDPYVTVGNFLFPNTTILAHPDHFQILTFTPHATDPGRVRMDTRLIVPPIQSDTERELWDRNHEILVNTVIMEDLPLNRSLQAAVSGRGLKPLILGRNETGNQVFHREWRRRIGEVDLTLL
jgi:phenylpropionate dioxygenase-like ring-hydroxylating dioxygenase large terminal subunit